MARKPKTEETVDETVSEVQPEIVDAEVMDEKSAAQTVEGEGAGQAASELLERAKAEADELRDRYARLQAEWDNYRKRTAAERDAERARASEKLVCDLLPVLDDLDRAIDHAKESGESGNLTDGVIAIRDKFLSILTKSKVEALDPMNESFDAMMHQAVGTAEDGSVPEETVVQVYQKGYRMGDRILRPAMVVTSTGGPARTDEQSSER